MSFLITHCKQPVLYILNLKVCLKLNDPHREEWVLLNLLRAQRSQPILLLLLQQSVHKTPEGGAGCGEVAVRKFSDHTAGGALELDSYSELFTVFTNLRTV